MTDSEKLKRTALYEAHVSVGARMTPFAGWEMPIQYSSILDEAKAVRARAGVFDVSHMGRVHIQGAGAADFLNRILSVDVPGVRMGRARYNVICDEHGGIIDDCILYRRGDERFLLIPNAGNTEAVLEWLARWVPGDGSVQIDDVTPESVMIAHQGPEAAAMLSGMADTDVSSMRPFTAIDARIAGADSFVARTGYTGEDGFELIVPQENGADVWRRLVDSGATPCGLGSRDVLRLEAGLLLHGNDMDTTINPYEAGLDRFVNPDRDGYIPGEALRRIRDDGPERRLVAFNMVERGIPRHGHAIMDGSNQIGHVSSGGHSPTLDRSIGLGYVPTGYTSVGSRFHIDIRGRLVEAEVTSLPFYSRRRNG